MIAGVGAGIAGARPCYPAQLDSLLAVGEAALTSGDLDAAAAAAGAARRLAPRDPRPLLLAGRADLGRRVGRFQALKSFRAAAALDPGSPEPLYWIGQVGVALKGMDGESIARKALEGVLASDPFYRDAWDLWLALYRSDRDRAAVRRVLRPRGAGPEIASRIAFLHLESGEGSAADSILAELQVRVGPDPRWSQWRAEAAFVEGRDSVGHEQYAEALALTSYDSTDEIWRAVAGIATPQERATYASLRPMARPEFFRGFWERRDPNLLTLENERIPEHFRRRAAARRRFAVKHPLSLRHYSAPYRDLVSTFSQPGRDRAAAALFLYGDYVAGELARVSGLPGSTRVITRTEYVGRVAEVTVSPDLRGLSPEILPLGVNLLDRVDDRGLTWIRQGPPNRTIVNVGGEEWWFYDDAPPLVLRFAIPSPEEAPVGDVVFRPVDPQTVEGIARAMATDRTSLPAPVEFGFWFARFRARADVNAVELYVFVEALRSAAALFDDAGRIASRRDAPPGAPILLRSEPGSYLLGVDVDAAGRLGRHRSRIVLPEFSDSLSVSDLLVSAAGETESPGVAPARDRHVERALPGLRAHADRPFWVYAEIYGATPDPEGRIRYEVEYEFVRERSWLGRLLHGRDRIAWRFEREAAPGPQGIVGEALRVEPREVAPGSYRLRIRVGDLVSGRVSQSRSVRVELRSASPP